MWRRPRAIQLLATRFLLLTILTCAACAPAAPAQKPSASAGASGPAQAAPPAAASPAIASSGPAGTTAGGATSGAQPLSPRLSVAVGVIGIFVDIGLLIAQERGYYDEEGLDVRFETFNNGAAEIPALASDQIQFGTAALDPSLFNAVARDIPLKIVSEKSRNSPTHGTGAVVARADLYDSGTLNQVSQLKGRKFAVASTGIPQRYAELALQKGGLALEDIEQVTMPFPDMPAALANGSVDAAWMNEPYLVLAEERGFARRLASAADLYPRLVTNILIISARFGQENPEAARRFVAAYMRGQRDYYRGFQLGQDEALR